MAGSLNGKVVPIGALARVEKRLSAHESVTDLQATQPVDLFAFLVMLTRMHRESAVVSSGTLVNELRGLPAPSRGVIPGAFDAETVDVVAMLFDCVFEDRHLPSTMKAQLGRLQVPTLKAALLDTSFFSSERHPARRLLDALAELGMGLDGDHGAARAAIDLVEDVVKRILAGFDADLALFESMAAMVETFIAADEEADANLVRRCAAIVEAREHREVALAAGIAEVTRRVQARTWMPSPVREMLLETWSKAFASVHLVEGEGSPAWQKLATTMDELLWSVEPKADPRDRKRLVSTLPGMLRDVVEGLRRAQLPQERLDAFLSTLVDCHALAVRAGLRGMAVVPEFRAAPRPEPKSTMEREMLAGGQVRIEEIRFRPALGGAAHGAIETRMQRGTWVEFTRTDEPAVRARLAWTSRGKGAYLFTNPLTGAAAISISPEALAELLRLGEARMLNDAPLIARALDSIATTLRDRTAAARNPSP